MKRKFMTTSSEYVYANRKDAERGGLEYLKMLVRPNRIVKTRQTLKAYKDARFRYEIYIEIPVKS